MREYIFTAIYIIMNRKENKHFYPFENKATTFLIPDKYE